MRIHLARVVGVVAGAMAVVLAGAVSAFAALPDGRAYELVSPPDKNGGIPRVGAFLATLYEPAMQGQ